MEKVIRRLLLAGFILSAGWLVSYGVTSQAGKDEYGCLARMVAESQAAVQYKKRPLKAGQEFDPAFTSQDSSLADINSDFQCWLSISGTNIHYPVVKEKTSGYYLNHTFFKKENPCGCLFLPVELPMEKTDNMIIFGHNMKDGSMFSDLKRYLAEDFFVQHQMLRLYQNGRWFQGKIYACCVAKEKEEIYQYRFLTKKDKAEYMRSFWDAAVCRDETVPDASFPLVTLSTCYGDKKRLIVQAVLMCYTDP